MNTPTLEKPMVFRLAACVLELYVTGQPPVANLCAVLMTPPGRSKTANQQLAFCSEIPVSCRVNVALWMHSELAGGTREVKCKLWMGGLAIDVSREQAEQIAATFAPYGLKVDREAYDCRGEKRGRTYEPALLAEVAAPTV